MLISINVGCTENNVVPTDEILTLPLLEPQLQGNGKLKIVATNSIIGNIVAQIGGEKIELTILIPAGQDPHSFTPSPVDLTTASDAQIIFVNGWNLEENLLTDLKNVAPAALFVPVSAGIKPLKRDGQPDPHSWLDPLLVKQWATNIQITLSKTDPNHTQFFQENEKNYQNQLDQLIVHLNELASSIPLEKRKMITNHDALGYFARAYQFTVVGTIIPSLSSLAEPSAQQLVSLIEAMKANQLCTIFTEEEANQQLVQTIAAELPCSELTIVPLQLASLGESGSETDTYLKMINYNATLIFQQFSD